MKPLPVRLPSGYSFWYEGHDVLVRFAVETGEPDTVWRGYEVWPVASWDEALWVSTQIASAIEQHRAQRQREALRIARIVVAPSVQSVPIPWADPDIARWETFLDGMAARVRDMWGWERGV